MNLITVIMPVFNGSKYLHHSIRSILNQNFRDFEFLIINDGSSDDSEQIIKKYMKKDKRIKYIYKNHGGITDTLNFGMGQAKGKWIARIDSDDLSSKDRFEKQLNIVTQDNSIVLCGTNLINIDANNNEISRYKYPAHHFKLVYRLFHGKPFFPHSSAFFSRDVALKVGGYRTPIKRAQDWDLWIRMSNQGNISCSSEYLTFIRKHSDQATTYSSNEQLLYSKLSVVSFLVARENIKDPIRNISEFKNWMYDSIQFKKLVREYIFFKDIKNRIIKEKGKVKKIILILIFLFSFNFIFFLKRYFLGDNLGMKMSKLWIIKNK